VLASKVPLDIKWEDRQLQCDATVTTVSRRDSVIGPLLYVAALVATLKSQLH
jgi:hypothetical protein